MKKLTNAEIAGVRVLLTERAIKPRVTVPELVEIACRGDRLVRDVRLAIDYALSKGHCVQLTGRQLDSAAEAAIRMIGGQDGKSH